ncbi:MAG: hypothetical protein WA418_34890 [Bradyrhizobium sp.]
MKILIGCETSGIVRRAFAAQGHDVWSCDLLASEDGSNRHIIDDVRNVMRAERWDFLAVLHPPCTRLCNSGVRWLFDPPGKIGGDHYGPAQVEAYKRMNREERLAFMWAGLEDGASLFSDCWNADIPMVCLENPRMHKHAKTRIANYQEATQTVQPWWFGEPQFKGVGLYLRNLPPLQPTNQLVPPAPGTDEHKKWSRVHRLPPSKNRWKERSRFFPGIGAAMAAQWGQAA